jgi:anti-sigma factor RsiW
MSECEAVRELLVLYLEGELPEGERARVGEHLAGCAACRSESAELDAVRAWLADPGLFAPGGPDFERLPEQLAAKAAALEPPARSWLPVNLGSFGWAASLAAAVVLGCGLIVMLPRQTPRAVHAVARGNAAFLRQMQSVYAREATAQYLSECQDLLLNVVRAEPSCEGSKYDVSIEVERASPRRRVAPTANRTREGAV